MQNLQPDVACIPNLQLCQKEENHHRFQPQPTQRREKENETKIIKKMWTPMKPLSPPLLIMTFQPSVN